MTIRNLLDQVIILQDENKFEKLTKIVLISVWIAYVLYLITVWVTLIRQGSISLPAALQHSQSNAQAMKFLASLYMSVYGFVIASILSVVIAVLHKAYHYFDKK